MAETSSSNLSSSLDKLNVTDEKEDSLNQLQSLHEMSDTSASVQSSDIPVDEKSEVERIVQKTLLQMQSTYLSENIDTLMPLIVPKVIADLRSYDQLHEEVQSIKESLNSYMLHSKSVDEDVAEIFLDLHNIYKRIENLGKLEPKKTEDKKFYRRLQEAEQFLKSNQHFISNASCQIGATSPMPFDNESIKPPEMTPRHDTREMERQAFLANMLMVKKSDFSLNLNRNKNYYTVAERALNKGNMEAE